MELELRRVSGEHEAAEQSQTNCPLVSSPLSLKSRLSYYLLAAVVSRRGCISHKAELSAGTVHRAAGLSVPFARLYRIFPVICLCRMRLRTSRGTLGRGGGGTVWHTERKELCVRLTSGHRLT